MRTILVASLACNLIAAAAVARIYLHTRIRSTASGHDGYYERRESLFDELKVSSRGRIVFVGDSITDQCEWAELLSLPALNRGIDSDTTAGVLERLGSIISLNPAKVFLLIGANDLHQGVPEETVIENYRQILRRLRKESPQALIYVQSILPNGALFPGSLRSINRRLADLAREQSAIYLDINSALGGSDGILRPEYTNDGVHLMGSGYKRWKTALIEAGAIRPGEGQ